MRRNCNLKLELQPSSSSFPSHQYDFANPHHQHQPKMEDSPDNHGQQLTIFYNGQVCVCDVTDLQARAIIMLASRETVGRSPSINGSGDKDSRRDQDSNSSISPPNHHRTTSVPSHSTSIPSPNPSPNSNNAMFMKSSLQRFLQKRRHRISASSPYNLR